MSFYSFYTLDSKAAQSETQTNSKVSAYSSGDPQIDFPSRIYLYVEGDDSTSKYLSKTRSGTGKTCMEISVTDAVEDKYDFQALLVNVSKQDGLNTPVYASSDPNILLFYTSAGETQNILNNSKKEM